jgi:hypothetical protein
VALQQAEEQGVEVVGLTIGFDSSHVPMCYQRWATAALPAALPDALQALYSSDAGSSSMQRGPEEDTWEELRPVVASAAATVQDVLQQQASFFSDLVKQLGEHKEAKLQSLPPCDLSVDVCFCIDVTGSMSGWLQACKEQISSIVNGLLPEIHKQHPGIHVEVRWSLVAYRDHGDSNQFDWVDFNKDAQRLLTKVGGGHVAVEGPWMPCGCQGIGGNSWGSWVCAQWSGS